MIIKKVLTYKLHVYYIACRIVSGGYRDSKAVPRLGFLVGTFQCDSSMVLQAQLKEITPALPLIVMCGDSLRMMQGLKTICWVPALLLFKIRREGLYVYCGYTMTALWGPFSGVGDLGWWDLGWELNWTKSSPPPSPVALSAIWFKTKLVPDKKLSHRDKECWLDQPNRKYANEKEKTSR